MLPPVHRQRPLVGGGQVLAAVGDRAGGRHVEAAEDVQQRRLAAAGRPEQDEELRFEQLEADAAQRVHVDLTHVVDLGDVARGEDGRLHVCRGHRGYSNCISDRVEWGPTRSRNFQQPTTNFKNGATD